MTKAKAWGIAALLPTAFAAVSGTARAQELEPGASAPASSSPPPAPPPQSLAPAASAPTASAPAPGDSGEMVFHPSRSDMGALAAGSMQQMRIGTTRARYAMNIFGDVDFQVGSQAGTHPSFSLGTLSFLITGELERHFVSTTEFALEYNDETNTVGVDIERLHVGWNAEHFFVYAGRVHTAFGYWNNAYHHGKWLQPNMERPRWVAFEDSGGLLPIHTVGLSGGAIAGVGPGDLKITLSVSNGRGNIVDDIRNRFDYQNSKALHAQIEYIGLGLPDLRVGISGMYDRIAPPVGMATRPLAPDVPIDEYILGAHVAYPGYPTLFIAEGYYVGHRVRGQMFATYGGFVTLGHAFGIVTPYVRGQWIGTRGGSDPFFVPVPMDPPTFDELEGLGGIRVDLTDWTAIRAEYRATRVAQMDVVHLGVLQWSWGF
jgi:hypothetical protein